MSSFVLAKGDSRLGLGLLEPDLGLHQLEEEELVEGQPPATTLHLGQGRGPVKGAQGLREGDQPQPPAAPRRPDTPRPPPDFRSHSRFRSKTLRRTHWGTSSLAG